MSGGSEHPRRSCVRPSNRGGSASGAVRHRHLEPVCRGFPVGACGSLRSGSTRHPRAGHCGGCDRSARVSTRPDVKSSEMGCGNGRLAVGRASRRRRPRRCKLSNHDRRPPAHSGGPQRDGTPSRNVLGRFYHHDARSRRTCGGHLVLGRVPSRAVDYSQTSRNDGDCPKASAPSAQSRSPHGTAVSSLFGVVGGIRRSRYASSTQPGSHRLSGLAYQWVR